MHKKILVLISGIAIGVTILVGFAFAWQKITLLQTENNYLREQLSLLRAELDDLRNADQIKINQNLKKELQQIKQTYQQAVNAYEELIKLREKTNLTQNLDNLFTDSLVYLEHENWSSGSASLASLKQQISLAWQKLITSFTIPANIPVSNQPPAGGFSRQTVSVDGVNYLVDLVAADLSTTKVIVDTASDRDCFNDCPVLSLGEYVARNGAFAGINGAYFCPAEYPSCNGKKNTFDTLLMNKNKTYFNSDNNVYSTVPAVIFLGNSLRFVDQSLQWGRDTSPDSLIANRPLLLSGGEIRFHGEGEPKEGNKGNRSFVGNKGNVVYIGVVHMASVAESGKVLKALGLDNALNLDDGGSTALWYGGYKVGPGRNLPNAILFLKK